jgi:hypothetical protein
MKKILMILGSLLGLAALTTLAADDETRFRRGEWDLSPFATYVDKAGDDWGLGASLTYFITDILGVGAATYWTDFGGTLFDNAAGEAYLRLPLGKSLAPYAVGSVGYQFDSEEWFETVGAGVDFRPFKNLSAFSDVQWRFANETRNGICVRLGIRCAF